MHLSLLTSRVRSPAIRMGLFNPPSHGNIKVSIILLERKDCHDASESQHNTQQYVSPPPDVRRHFSPTAESSLAAIGIVCEGWGLWGNRSSRCRPIKFNPVPPPSARMIECRYSTVWRPKRDFGTATAVKNITGPRDDVSSLRRRYLPSRRFLNPADTKCCQMTGNF
jgi:hypothetical protein